MATTEPAALTTASVRGAASAPAAAPEPAPAPDPVPASAEDTAKATKAAVKAGAPIEVVESFTTLVRGAEVHYRKGELVHPEDPVLSRSPELFRPLVYPHGRNGLGAPGVRS